jgi:hypothetical protein
VKLNRPEHVSPNLSDYHLHLGLTGAKNSDTDAFNRTWSDITEWRIGFNYDSEAHDGWRRDFAGD